MENTYTKEKIVNKITKYGKITKHHKINSNYQHYVDRQSGKHLMLRTSQAIRELKETLDNLSGYISRSELI